MLKTALIAAGALLIAAASVPAEAGHTGPSVAMSGSGISIHIGQPGYHGHGHSHWKRPQVLPPREVFNRLHRQGFSRIYGLQLRGNVYVARAQARHGQWVRVSANAYTGQVLWVRSVR